MQRSNQNVTNLLAGYCFDPGGAAKRTGSDRPVLRSPRTFASIVVVSRNSRKHLESCLNSLLYNLALNCEVIVVDNASTDGSAEYVAEYFPWVHLVRNNRNVGLAAAANIGASTSIGSYIVALGPEVEVTQGWLGALLTPLIENNSVGITTPRVLITGPSGELIACGNRVHYAGFTASRSYHRAGEGTGDGGELPANSNCFAMSRNLWEQLGGLDGSFFSHLKATDLSLRVRMLGFSCLYTPESVVYTAQPIADALTEDARSLYYNERDRILMLLKCYSSRTFLLLLPGLLLSELTAWSHAAKGGRKYLAAKLRAYRWLVANWQVIARKRRETQAARRCGDTGILKMMTGSLRASLLVATSTEADNPTPLAGTAAFKDKR